MGVDEGDEVICQSWTFSASVNPVRYLGAKPVFVDSEKETCNIDPQLLSDAIKNREKKTGKRPKAIVAVDLYGMPAKWNEIIEISERFGIPILEDSAVGMGSSYKGMPCGTLGMFGVFSFNGNKMITTGAGDALICPDKETKERALYFATQARSPLPYYHHEEIGYNYRLSNISEAIGCGQMEVLDGHIEHYRMLHKVYTGALVGFEGIKVYGNPSGDYHSNFWLTTILLDDKVTGVTPDEVRLKLDSKNIETRPLWKPMHLQPVYQKYPAYLNGLSESLWDKGLCLPSGPKVSKEDARYLVDEIKKAIKQ